MSTSQIASTPNPAFWDAAAEKYAASPVKDPATFERKIAITKSLMRPEHVVLDVGCGTGSLALRLADSAADVHGLDLSAEMIRIARDKTIAQGASNVRFHVGAFDESFDAVAPGTLDGLCAYSILHLLARREAALAQMHALLKPGGFFVTSTACLKDSWVPFGPLVKVMQWFGKAPWVGMLTKEQLTAEIEAAGFVDVQDPGVGGDKMIAFLTARKPA